MASCAQIDQLIQPYLDRELPHSDRVILEQHVGECRACAALVRRHQASDAELFETFRTVRIDRDMTDYVLSHLPEMERPQVDVASLNRRAKSAGRMRERVFRLVPIAAAVLLVFLAAVLNTRWPEAGIRAGAVGMVAYADGDVHRLLANKTGPRANEKAAAMGGDRFETAPGAHASVMLLGPSEVRMDSNTAVKVVSDRRIALERGRVYLDIASSRRWFKVVTPMGEVTVFGTKFSVEANSGRTTVTVEEGEVQLTHRDNPRLFRSIKPNQKAYIEAGLEAIPVSRTDAKAELQWAEAFAAPQQMRDYFMARVQPAYEVTEVAAEPVYMVSGNGPLQTITVQREDASPFVRYCDYEVFVSTANNEPYFHAHIDGTDFSDPRRDEIDIEVMSESKPSGGTFWVKLVPVLSATENVRQVGSLSVSATFIELANGGT